MDGYRTVIEKRDISENLFLKISLSSDESMVYLNIGYLDNKFTIEKIFKNNTFDLEFLDSEIGKLDSEEKVRKYLNLGVLNDNTEEN